MGYVNANTGDLRKTRQQQRRQAVQAPVGQTAIGHGDGLRVYDDGKIILDGDDLKIIFQILNGSGFITYYAANRAGLRADPAFWANENVFVVAGPLRSGSSAAAGYGGSNLYLYSDSAEIIAGAGGSTSASVRVSDDGGVYLSGRRASAQLHPDGAWSFGAGGNGVLMQGAASGGMGVWPGSGGMTVSGDFSVSGSKNFIMAHPTKPDTLLRYGSTESPVSAIECRGRVTLDDDGLALVELPEHFTAIVKPGTDVDVHLQPYSPDPVWCEVPTAEGTTVHGTPGTVVAWQANAERAGGDFIVEEPGTLPVAPNPDTIPAPTETEES